MQRAYRRPVTDADLRGPLALYREGAARRAASRPGSRWRCRRVLVSPQFLFRVEPDPAGVRAEHAVSRQRPRAGVAAVVLPVEQHSGRRAAGRGDRRQAARAGGARAAGAADAGRRPVAGAGDQLRRAVAAPAQSRRRSLRTCGCSRTSTTTCGRPSARKPSSSSRASCARIAACSTCCAPNYTFLNERLAKHYGIPHVYGSRFRRVALDEDSERGGLLRQGSILTVTSYATRTSPVLRGKWILDNLLGVPPPPPLPDVPALKDNTVDGNLAGPRAAGRAPEQRDLRRAATT